MTTGTGTHRQVGISTQVCIEGAHISGEGTHRGRDICPVEDWLENEPPLLIANTSMFWVRVAVRSRSIIQVGGRPASAAGLWSEAAQAAAICATTSAAMAAATAAAAACSAQLLAQGAGLSGMVLSCSGHVLNADGNPLTCRWQYLE